MNRGDVKLIIDRCIAHDVPDAADLIERQAAQIEMLREAIRFWMAAEGDYDMIKAGKIFTKALSTTPNQAFEQFAE